MGNQYRAGFFQQKVNGTSQSESASKPGREFAGVQPSKVCICMIADTFSVLSSLRLEPRYTSSVGCSGIAGRQLHKGMPIWSKTHSASKPSVGAPQSLPQKPANQPRL